MINIAHLDIIGKPRPKGSLRFLGKGRAAQEQVKGSVEWKDHCTKTIRLWMKRSAQSQVQGLSLWPWLEPVEVRLLFRFQARPGAREEPTERQIGDLDKLVRNVLDALTQGGLIGDDSQVVRLLAEKCYSPGLPGVVIDVLAM